ncbi:hypothetical protein [Haloferula sp.]|uniref:hypothetical protein n=1 Tax=Haloferula sp. TaxID=2497595 RepID=UPI0032A086A8
MHLLNTYDDQEDAEAAEKLLTGAKRLASDRDDNEVIYRLFGEPTWSHFFKLGMYDLQELKTLVEARKKGEGYDPERHQSILSGLKFPANTYGLSIPEHWL